MHQVKTLWNWTVYRLISEAVHIDEHAFIAELPVATIIPRERPNYTVIGGDI